MKTTDDIKRCWEEQIVSNKLYSEGTVGVAKYLLRYGKRINTNKIRAFSNFVYQNFPDSHDFKTFSNLLVNQIKFKRFYDISSVKFLRNFLDTVALSPYSLVWGTEENKALLNSIYKVANNDKFISCLSSLVSMRLYNIYEQYYVEHKDKLWYQNNIKEICLACKAFVKEIDNVISCLKKRNVFLGVIGGIFSTNPFVVNYEYKAVNTNIDFSVCTYDGAIMTSVFH